MQVNYYNWMGVGSETGNCKYWAAQLLNISGQLQPFIDPARGARARFSLTHINGTYMNILPYSTAYRRTNTTDTSNEK